MKNREQNPVDPCLMGGFCLASGLLLYFLGLGPIALVSLHAWTPEFFVDLYFTPLQWIPDTDFFNSLIGMYIELWTGPQC